ncbi:MAG: sialate O-acetylesterase [Planctomycetaceae bacterium]|nr:sialate O-acetylesterase [Planctomycetaceae bacterium]
MKMLRLVLVVAALISLSGISITSADVKLPTVLDSHMVLQREMPLPVWGWAEAGEEVTVTLGENSAKAKADDKGNWRVELPAMKADGKSHSITVKGNNTIELTDILIGDVWIGSGQSNMEWQLANTHGAKEAIATADHSNIRLFHVPKVQKPEPATDVVADWKACTPENVPTFSAVLYHFGLKLHEEVDVPIGLINSSWGGSPIEPWTPANGKAAGMYNGMIAPLQPFPVRGAIWYQGETNVLRKNGLAYYDKMKSLIGGWREAWGNDFPFYFVQIAPWSGRYEPGELPALWEGQAASLKIPNTGMAVITDLVDNIADIHPRNKVDVGDRLALWALAKSYGKSDVLYSGPLYKSMKVEGDKIRINFAHVGESLKTRDGKAITEFQIAGADGKFVDATAEIDGETVVVHSDKVSDPKNVRFGWHKLANPNLVNCDGLPASPFQTNDWQGGTGE